MPAEGLFKDRGSRFLSCAYPVASAVEALELVSRLRSEYHDARHHCFAYRIGADGDIYRANDDGEPSGTAGRPILGQLLSAELTNVLIVVVRYFGGVKLGVSGLMAAYKEAARDVIANAHIVEKVVEQQFSITFNYTEMNAVMRIVKEFKPQIESQTFDNISTTQLSIPQSLSGQFAESLKRIDGVTVSYIE